ncbi:MAG TPA: hemolysin family protein [Vicinamibacteria bacterium]|nr:hemolysin family protein [Vicinamibacteria bacterium]
MIAVALFVIVLLAVVSVALASVEAAYYLVKRRKLTHLAQQNERAETVNRYLEDPQTLLMPVHMGTYTAHVALTVLVTMLLTDHLHLAAVFGALGIMILYLLVFRLTLPYALVWRNPERSLLILLPVFHLYARAMKPLVNALRRRARAEPLPEEGTEAAAVPVPEVPPPPVHEQDEGRMMDAVARFGETQVRDVMTPRPDIVALPRTATVDELRRLLRETKYSRVPVFGENLDDVVGVVSLRDLLDYDGPEDATLPGLVREAYVVPETKRVAELLKDFQARRITFAMAVDEYGGIAGLVTVEDIVEELVGEIKDEYDMEAEPILVEPDGAVLVSGRVNVDRVEQALETGLSNGDVGTVGGLVTTVFGRVPRPGEKMEHRGFVIEVVDAEKKRVHRVRFRRKPAEEEPAEAS